MRKIVWWLGSDALLLTTNPPSDSRLWYVKLFLYRIKWKLLSKLFDIHWIVNERLSPHLEKIGVPKSKIVIKEDVPLYPNKITKENHSGFFILYYCPTTPANMGGQKFLKWLYGWDVFEALRSYYKNNKNIEFIHVKGDADMSVVYPLIDLYIRPTRSDGHPRMIQECEINRIPYIYSKDGQPSVSLFINQIDKYYELW